MKRVREFFSYLAEIFHGKGHRAYTSMEAKKKFADSLLSVSASLFWVPMGYLALSLYDGRELSAMHFVFSGILIVMSISTRHEGLKIYDKISAE